MNLKDLATQISGIGLPLLGAALAGPAGATVGKLIASRMGLSSDTPEALSEAITNSKDVMETNLLLRRLEADHEEFLIKAAQAAIDSENADRASARSREVETKDDTNRQLAGVVIIGFMVACGAVLFKQVPDSVLAGTVIGFMSAKAEQVIAYYFGSTSGSTLKTKLMAAMGKNKEAA